MAGMYKYYATKEIIKSNDEQDEKAEGSTTDDSESTEYDPLCFCRNNGDGDSLDRYLEENNIDHEDSSEEEEDRKPPCSVQASRGSQKYYAVANGRNIGVYDTWAKCLQEVHGYSRAVYQSFANKEEAIKFTSDYCDHNNKKKPKEEHPKKISPVSVPKTRSNEHGRDKSLKTTNKSTKTNNKKHHDGTIKGPRDQNNKLLCWGIL